MTTYGSSREGGRKGGREGKNAPSWRRDTLSEGGEEAGVDVPQLFLHRGGNNLLETAEGLGEEGREGGIFR